MEKYVKVRKIGQGSFGCAYLATRKPIAGSTQLSKQQFVIKEIVLDPRDQVNAQREARLLAALDHPNIIACKESFILKPSSAFLGPKQRSSVLCIVTDFADGGDLSQALERRSIRQAFFTPDELLGFFVQICLALKHLHDRKILHRDVKPANIFLTKSGVVKLGDLGVATVLSHTLACAQTSIGTPYYTAPEICLGKRYNAKADVWSLGCVLFEMATFAHAFDGRSQRQLFANIVSAVTPQLPVCGQLNSIRKELQMLVNDMLHKEPRARPSVNQLIHRPVVLSRIQSFLSTRALNSELNHTVLHGENVFRKKSLNDEKAFIAQAQNVRRAELVDLDSMLKPAIKPFRQVQKVVKPSTRIKSRLGASRKPRGLNSRPVQKRIQPAQAPSKANVVKRVGSVQAKKPEIYDAKMKVKARMKLNEDAAAVAALPEPPKVAKKVKQVRASGVSERVAAFNAKWGAQHEQLVNNLPLPPPTTVGKVLAKKLVSEKPKQSGKSSRKPLILSIKGKNLKTPPPPAPVDIRPPKLETPLFKPKTRDNQPSIRERRLEFQRKKQVEVANLGVKHSVKASPLDDPIILVQQLPELPLLPPPAPTSLTSSLPQFADKDKGLVELASDSTEEDQELTSLPAMANLEFERMILQLKSVVESDLTSSDSENDEEEQAFDPVFDANVSPPPYTTSPTLETLSIKVLEDLKFRSTLEKKLLQHKMKTPDTEDKKEDFVMEDPTQEAILTWMYTYITSLI